MKGYIYTLVENMKNEFFGSNYLIRPLYVKKDALKKVHTINNLSLFLKNYVLVSQFSGIYSSLECIIIMCTCVHMRKQVRVLLCVHMYVLEQVSRLIIKILSMKPESGILRQWSASYN